MVVQDIKIIPAFGSVWIVIYVPMKSEQGTLVCSLSGMLTSMMSNMAWPSLCACMVLGNLNTVEDYIYSARCSASCNKS